MNARTHTRDFHTTATALDQYMEKGLIAFFVCLHFSGESKTTWDGLLHALISNQRASADEHGLEIELRNKPSCKVLLTGEHIVLKPYYRET